MERNNNLLNEDMVSAQVELLRICHVSSDVKSLIKDLVTFFRSFTGCEAVGVRLHKEYDFPYYEVRGFPEEFVEAERFLCARDLQGVLIKDTKGNPLIECMCGNVICGRFDPTKPFFTKHGSFWSNCTSKLLATTTDADRQSRTRNRCNGEGYESVALVPIISNGKRLGLFQFNDRKTDMFSLEKIEFFEQLVDYVALAVSNLETAEALAESESRYRSFIESAKEGIWGMDEQHLTTYVNPYMANLLGYSVEEMMGQPVEYFFFEEDLPEHEKVMAEREKGNDDPYERRFKHKDGSSLWMNVSPKPIIDDLGNFRGSFAFFTDITNRRRMGDLQKSRLDLIQFSEHHSLDELLQQTLDVIGNLTESPIGFYHFLAEDQVTLTLKAWSSETENTYCTAGGKESHYPVDQAGVWVECIHQRHPVIHNDYASLPNKKGMPEGHAQVIRELVVPIFRGDIIKAVLGVGNKSTDYTQQDVALVSIFADLVWDISERKIAEEKLRKSEERLSIINSNTPDHIVMHDKDLRYTYVLNPQLGLTEAEMIGKTDYDFLPEDEAERLVKIKKHVLETGQPLEYETSLISHNGNSEYFSGTFVPSFNNDGHINGLIGYFRNVTKEKKVEAALFGEKQRLVDIITATNAGTWEWNIQTGENVFNERWAEMIGFTLDELLPTTYDTWLKIVHPEDLKKSSALLQKHFKGELDYYECELRMQHKNGHWVWVLDRGKVTQWTEDGRPLMMYGTHQDITKHKEAEEALRENQEMLSLFISNSPIYTFIKEVSATESRVLQVSDNYVQMIGIPNREMVGKTMEELFPPEFARKISSDDWDVVQKGKVLQLVEELNDRSYTTIKFPIQQHDRTLLAGYTIDITERKRAENELLKHQKLLEESQNIARLGSYIVDFENNSRYWTREMFHIFAMDDNLPPPSLGEFQSLIHPDDAKYEHDQFMESKQTGSNLDITYRIITNDGETRYIHELGTPETDIDGKVIRIIGSIQDITKTKLAEERLHESESRFRTLTDLLPVGVYLTDLKGDCLYANGKWLEIAGLSLEDALGSGWSNALHHEDKKNVWTAWNRMVESHGNWGLEYRFMTPEGKITWVYGLATPLKNEKGEISGFVGANLDITERKLMQDILQTSLAEKDVLLREVHHRVKNNLAAILGLLEMERQNTADPNAGKLLIDLSNRIKAMSTVHEKLYRSENLAKIDFQDYLKSFLSHLRTSFVSGREITTKLEAAGIELSLDIAVPCGLIVNELVTNSLKYAFPNGKPGVLGEKLCEIRVSMDQEDSAYTLVVSDNGVGLPKNIDWREANSLGLRLVRMLGEHQLGGEIELDKSRGTRFMIRFNTKEREL